MGFPAHIKIRTPTIASPIVKDRRSLLREKLSKGTVGWSEDFDRIGKLARRERPDADALALELTERLKTPNGTMKLRPIQAWALHEASQRNGLIGNIAVGAGKELVGMLMPMVMQDCKRAVLMIPPDLRAQFYERDWPRYSEHWRMPNLAGGSKFIIGRPVLHVVAYSELSSPKATRLLEEINPDLIICNEIQNLKLKASARTKRFLRYFAEQHQTRLVGWSGTLLTNSIKNAAHLCAIALDEGSPMPINPSTVEEWSSALDPHDIFYDPGVLRGFSEPGENILTGYRRRIVDTPGFIATSEEELGTSLIFYERKAPPTPDEVQSAIRQLRRAPEQGGWRRPDGEELVDALRVVECVKQLASGFYYYWDFPRGEPLELRKRWFMLRQDWNRELRAKIKRAEPFLDSDGLCENAAKRFFDGGCPGCSRGPAEPHEGQCKIAIDHPLWESQTYLAWREIKDEVYHVQKSTWVSDFLLEDIATWMRQAPGIVWVDHVEVGHRLARLTGFPYFGGGDKASSEIIHEKGDRPIIASVQAHHKGKNLQEAFWRNLIVSISPNAAELEQLVGRTHREGQPKDEVEVHYYAHIAELSDTLDKAKERAKFVNDILGSPQKLIYGNWGKQ